MSLQINKNIKGKIIFQCDFGYMEIEDTTKNISFVAKVISVSHNKTTAFATVTLTSEEGMVTSQDHQLEITLDGDNTIKQTYEYLKTLDEYSDAVDI